MASSTIDNDSTLVDAPPSRLTGCGQIMTKTKTFKAIVSKAFEMIDDSGDGVIDKAELYAGLLLVHLNLAKNAGPAACYPPTRVVCDRIFRAADIDGNGVLDHEQFHWVMGVLCAQILARMVVFFAVMIITVPFIGSWAVELANVPEKSYMEKLIRVAISLLVLFLIVPALFNAIDARFSGSVSGTIGADSSLLPSDRHEERQQRR